MKGRLTLQQRLILPIVLLGMITLLSNILAVFSINNVHANAGGIVDKSMVSEERLEDIRRSVMDIHRLALSHIVAADHATMIQLVQEIKAEEASLDEKLGGYEAFVSEEDREAYQSLLNGYAQFKHALVYLVSASADSKTQAAYTIANGDAAAWSRAAEEDIDALYGSVSGQAEAARGRLFLVYVISLLTSAATLTAGVLLVAAAFRIIRRSVIAPIQEAMGTLQDSSERISGVVGEVRQRTRTSSGSARTLSGATEQLSAALEEIAGSTSAIRAGRGDGALRPPGAGGGSGQDGGDHGHAGPGHREEPERQPDQRFDQGHPEYLLLHRPDRHQRRHRGRAGGGSGQRLCHRGPRDTQSGGLLR